MNKITYKFSIIIIGLFSLFLSFHSAQATVGGPTFVSSLAYNARENAFYYTEVSHSGRGCPPIVHRIDLATSIDTEVVSCDQFEQDFSYSDEGMSRYNKFIADIYQTLTPVGSVSLAKNKIDVVVEKVSEEIQAGEKFWTTFRAGVRQDGRQIAVFEFRGCDASQPHLFEGYMIPNTNKMALLLSNKGDCFEGGYVYESLWILDGVQYFDTNIVRAVKDAVQADANSGTLVVAANASPEPTTPTDQTTNPSTPTVPSQNKNLSILFFVFMLLIVVVAGFYFGRKFLRNS